MSDIPAEVDQAEVEVVTKAMLEVFLHLSDDGSVLDARPLMSEAAIRALDAHRAERGTVPRHMIPIGSADVWGNGTDRGRQNVYAVDPRLLATEPMEAGS